MARPPTDRRGGTRARSRRGERGAGLVEFALVVPLLFALLFAVVDFGLNLSNSISVRQGVREAARQGTVANVGTVSSCGNSFTSTATPEMAKLVCLTKSRIGVSGARVAIRFDPASSGLAAAAAYPAGSGSPPVGNGLLICATVPIESYSKVYGPVISGKHLTSKVDMRIEKSLGTQQTQVAETDPTGKNWSWCTP